MKCGSPQEQAVLKWVASQARQIAGAHRVLLFGSRARGDASDRSEFDIAIETMQAEKILELRAVLEDNPYKLLAFDGVNLNEVSQQFRQRILSEGKPIF